MILYLGTLGIDISNMIGVILICCGIVGLVYASTIKNKNNGTKEKNNL